MGNPGVPGTGEGKMVGVGNVAGFDYPLPSSEMPPQIRIGRRA